MVGRMEEEQKKVERTNDVSQLQRLAPSVNPWAKARMEGA